MDDIDDSVSGTNPSTAFLSYPDHFAHEIDDQLWSVMLADLNENQGDHVPLPVNQDDHVLLPVPAPVTHLQNLETTSTSTSTSILDRDLGRLHEMPEPLLQPGKNNSSSDCWSAASEAVSPNFFSEASFKERPIEGEIRSAAEMIIHNQEIHNVPDMDDSDKHLPSCNAHLLSLEGDGEDFMSVECNGDEIQSESTVNLEDKIYEVNSQIPELGMVFSSEEEAYKFYKTFAKETGFCVRKGKVRRQANGIIRKRFFVCSREGFRIKKQPTHTAKCQRKETRTGCEARVELTTKNEKWVISGFVPEHNHDLEGKSKLMVGSSANISEDYSISTTMNKAVKDTGPANSVGFLSIDCSSFSHDEKTSSPQLVDGQSLINYFRRLQVEDPLFFHTVKVNAENCLTNFFWSDGRSQMDYEYFGDVLILDTTFRIDASNMTYVPFLGMNHHRQYVLFGGSFLLDNSKDSFIWLFRTFLDAMGRNQPKTIITDGCQAMSDAIKLVSPKTQHILGIWYILQDAKKHLYKCCGQDGFDIIFNKCIFECKSEEEFELSWQSLLEQYDLRENPWLKTLYMLRRKWSRFFCESIFSAGIQSIQGCHSISQFFNRLTSKATTPLQLVQQYSKVAEQQRREELYEDFRCKESAPATILRSNAIEKEAANIYTCAVFKLFQEELLGCLSVAVEEIPGDEMTTKFRLTEEGNKEEKIVEFNCLESPLTCSCKKYESVGILCVHALKVLNARNIFHIPPQYILKRWTKSAKDGMLVSGHEGEVVDDSQRHVYLHKSKLIHKAMNVITKSLAVEETVVVVEAYLNMASKKVEDVLRTRNIGHLNINNVEVYYKGDDAAADDNICVETQQTVSNPSRINQQETTNHKAESHLQKRKRENEVKERNCKSSDGFVSLCHSFKEAAKGDDQGPRRGPSRSYCVAENSRYPACISRRPPLPLQSACPQFKDPSRSTGNIQVRVEELEKEISKLRHENQRVSKVCISMHADYSRFEQFILKNKLIHQQNLSLQQRLKAMKEDNAKVSVTVESLPEQNSEQN